MIVAPGIYPRGSIDYDAIQAVNFSTLKELSVSAKRYRHRLRSPRKATSPMALGSAAHTAVLEPHRFMSDYALFTGKIRRGKKWDAFVATNEGKSIIKADEHAEAMAMRDAIRSDSVAKRYIEFGEAEVALVWTDEETGLLCKGRVDWLCHDPADVLADVKTSGNIESYRFCQSAAKLQYHLQTAFYSDGYKAITGRDPEFKVIAVEQSDPHDVAVYDMPPEVLDQGREDYRELLAKLRSHQSFGTWPGYANGSELTFQLPAWALTEDDELTELGLER